jgi:hypothetical protein
MNDENTPRFCDSDISRLGYMFTLRHYLTRKYYTEYVSECIELIWNGLLAIAVLAILPIAPFIRAYIKLYRARQAVRRSQNA